jgi:membrane fusion protein, multidrug efflux system
LDGATVTRAQAEIHFQDLARSAIGACAVFCAFIASTSAQQKASDAVPVGAIQAERKPIAKTKDFVGRVQAINKAEVHARITGYLEDVLFKEGELVKEGQPLYRIEKGLFQAAVDNAEGELAGDKAKKLLTQVEYERAAELAKTARARSRHATRRSLRTATRMLRS